jgi:hypothetical protein
MRPFILIMLTTPPYSVSRQFSFLFAAAVTFCLCHLVSDPIDRK